MALLAVVFLSLLCAVRGLDLHVVEPSGFMKLSSCGQSALYGVQAASDYDRNPLLVHLAGSRYGEWVGLACFVSPLLHPPPSPDIGYAYGYLLNEQISDAYRALLQSLLGDKWYDEVRGRGWSSAVPGLSRVQCGRVIWRRSLFSPAGSH